jgi:hypothetical protein
VKQTVNYQVITKLLSYDYKNAFERIGFTVMGILIALWINRCDEGLKRRELERKSLVELKNALLIDLKDIDETLTTIPRRPIDRAIDYMEGRPVNPDSVHIFFQYSFFHTFQLANTSAYETLKSRGLDLIRNDSLRTAIATLYDVTYEHQSKMEKIRSDAYDKYVNPARVAYFLTPSKGPGVLRNVDFEAVRRDKTVLTALKVHYEEYNNNQKDFQVLKKGVEELIAMIDAELK